MARLVRSNDGRVSHKLDTCQISANTSTRTTEVGERGKSQKFQNQTIFYYYLFIYVPFPSRLVTVLRPTSKRDGIPLVQVLRHALERQAPVLVKRGWDGRTHTGQHCPAQSHTRRVWISESTTQYSHAGSLQGNHEKADSTPRPETDACVNIAGKEGRQNRRCDKQCHP